MSALDRRMDIRNAVLHYPADSAAGVATLVVDQGHAFFFDHPLDHVPGLLLLEGAVQAAQNCARGPCFVSEIEAEFIQYSLFDAPILLATQSDDRDGHQRCIVEITQQGTLRARLKVRLAPLTQPMQQRPHPARRGPDCALPPCAAGLLNKTRPENVLITTPTITDKMVEARLLPLSADCLFADTTQAVHPLYLLEAFMQVQRYLNATQEGEQRIRDILTGVSIKQIAPIADLSGGVYLRGARDFVQTEPFRLSRSAWLYAQHKPFAICTIQTARVTSRAKHRLS